MFQLSYVAARLDRKTDGGKDWKTDGGRDIGRRGRKSAGQSGETDRERDTGKRGKKSVSQNGKNLAERGADGFKRHRKKGHESRPHREAHICCSLGVLSKYRES